MGHIVRYKYGDNTFDVYGLGEGFTATVLEKFLEKHDADFDSSKIEEIEDTHESEWLGNISDTLLFDKVFGYIQTYEIAAKSTLSGEELNYALRLIPEWVRGVLERPDGANINVVSVPKQTELFARLELSILTSGYRNGMFEYAPDVGLVARSDRHV